MIFKKPRWRVGYHTSYTHPEEMNSSPQSYSIQDQNTANASNLAISDSLCSSGEADSNQTSQSTASDSYGT